MIRTAIAILLGLFVSGSLACGGLRRGADDRAPAPDFHTISDDQLQSAMWRLADGVLRLQAMFGSEGADPS